MRNLGTVYPDCNTNSQAEDTPACNLEVIPTEFDPDIDLQVCRFCIDHSEDRGVCWRHRQAVYRPDYETCDDWRYYGEEKEVAAADDGKIVLVTLHTGDQESYTPPEYIEAAREVMGSIDTDPASCDEAQAWIKAKVYYTKADNGLGKPWAGNIFLNPPYSHPEVKLFVDKLLRELKPGQQGILLTNNNTDTNFFHDAARRAAAVCFTKGRIRFRKPDGSYSSPTNGQVFFYFGDRVERFSKVFSQIGLIMGVVGVNMNSLGNIGFSGLISAAFLPDGRDVDAV